MIDLRSDTVTRPSAGMRKAMAEAEVGDDVFGEDPTVNKLQDRLAEILGTEAALFVPSGTMGNEICVKVHTHPGQEVICEAGCHILNYESGAAAFLAGVQLTPIQGIKGILSRDLVEAAIRPPQYYYPQTALISIENTHNSAGGTVFPLAQIADLFKLAQEKKLSLHLDGARIWNASVATGTAIHEYSQYCDSLSVCFSKGLGAPIGSAVAGSKEFITEAHRFRKIMGGGMRQAGILAAAVLYALDNNMQRLAEDHENARILASALHELSGIELDLEKVETNIIVFEIAKSTLSSIEAIERLKAKGVLVVPMGVNKLRAVTHMDCSQEDIQNAISAFQQVFTE